MTTIKLNIDFVNEEDKQVLINYQHQYSCCVRFLYERIKDKPNIAETQLRNKVKSLNNINLLDTWFIQSAIYEAKQTYAARKTLEFNLTKKQKRKLNQDQINKKQKKFEHNKFRVIWGGRKNFEKLNQNKINKEEWLKLRLLPISSIGEACKHGNRKFKLLNEQTLIFKPNSKTKIQLNLNYSATNYFKILQELINQQENNSASLTYKLDDEFVYITYDETIISKEPKYQKVSDRVFAIDMNPNYIGWVVVDWKSENQFKLIDSGVIKFKQINDLKVELKGKGYGSSSTKWKYLNNKLTHETLMVSKHLVNLSKHYGCETFVIEDLNIKGKDLDKGKDYNRLINNSWLRKTLTSNLIKRCNISHIRLIKAKPEYSSSNGNILFRWIGLPDMCLAAFELSRRGYEFVSQYIKHTKEKKKNIIHPDLDLFQNFYIKSQEEFDIEGKNLVQMYQQLKNSKRTYRVSLPDQVEFQRLFSNKSLISQLKFGNIKNISL